MTSIAVVLPATLAPGGGAWAQSAAPLAAPSLMTVEGEVINVRSRWTADEESIISEAVIRGDDGTETAVVQLGGRVDGIAMIASHHPRPLRAGQRVRARMAATASPGLYTLQDYTPVRAALLADDLRTARYGVNRTGQSLEPIYWASGCIHLSYDEAGSSHLPGDTEFDIIDQATAEWEDETSVCSGLTFSSTFVTAAQPGRNRLNTVVWREDKWCRPATATTPEICHDAGNIAVTQVFFIDDPTNPRDGEIVEADIEFNGVHYAFNDNGVTEGPSDLIQVDLRATATHELGHLLGLTHNCAQPLEEPATDHQGNPVPDCTLSDLGTEITEATMYYAQAEGETKKSTLETEDVLAGCAVLNSVECNRVVRGAAMSCSAARPDTGSALVVALMLLYWMGRRGRGVSVRTRAGASARGGRS